jgi:hypothetical protein
VIFARAVALALAALGVLACTTLVAEERPALIEQPTQQSEAELLTILGDAFYGRPVTIADDALTHDSVLVIERSEQRGLEGNPAGGRVLETPEQFHLVLRDGRCELVRSSDQRRWTLTQTSCVPNPGAPKD